ncbi:MAG TPA: hypothetical protein DCE44_03265 [Verrucomicrobiales bacterium]|nr:hypothetical protein [Verrucomicrobiales bacterium]
MALTGIYVGVLVGLQVVVTVILMVAKRPPMSAWSMVGQMVVAFAFTAALVPVLAKLKWSELVTMLRVSPPLILGAGFLVAGAWVVALELGGLTELLIPIPEFMAQEFERLFNNPDVVSSLVLLVLVPPIVEETLCRGLILRAMLKKWRPRTAIILSALIFGAIHLNPWQFFYATWLGLVLGWVYWRTQSLGLCMLMHAGNNLLSWILLRSKFEWIGMDRESLTAPPNHVPPLVMAVGLGLLGLGVALLARMTPRPVPVAAPQV